MGIFGPRGTLLYTTIHPAKTERRALLGARHRAIGTTTVASYVKTVDAAAGQFPDAAMCIH